MEEDNAERDGEQTLHSAHGVAIALNAGDLLIGEGYRLLAESGPQAAVIAAMTRIAASGPRQVCLGQGAELDWQRRRRSLSSLEVLNIFRQKTAPAFEVALRLGAAFAGAEDDVHSVLGRFSESLGIAYQIRDDLEDLDSSADLQQPRPSLPLAVAFERVRGDGKALLDRLWLGAPPSIDEERGGTHLLAAAGPRR